MASNVATTTSNAANKPALPHMHKLSPTVLLHRPEPGAAATDPASPELILLATWVDARDMHIAKYVAQYAALYPAATILVAKSYLRDMFIESAARRDLAPAVPVIREILGDGAPSGKARMLIHAFSNGGSCTLYHLYDLYEASQAGSTKLPLHVTVFDSAPGCWSWASGTNVVLLGLPAGLIRTIALPFVNFLALCYVIKYSVFRRPDELRVWSARHNEPERAREVCRAYMYSDADVMSPSYAVEAHADDAEAAGYVVARREKFDKSQHVAHARTDPDRYWRVVRETWEAGKRGGALSK